MVIYVVTTLPHLEGRQFDLSQTGGETVHLVAEIRRHVHDLIPRPRAARRNL